jgi:hypothetical protein
MAMVPAVMMVTVMPPTNFRRHRPGIFPHNRRSAGIAERERAGLLGRRCYSEHCADGGKAQNFRDLHGWSPRVLCRVRDERSSTNTPHRRDAVRRLLLMT